MLKRLVGAMSLLGLALGLVALSRAETYRCVGLDAQGQDCQGRTHVQGDLCAECRRWLERVNTHE